MTAGRLAIYWAPERNSELARFGDRWLGRDVTTGAAIPQLAVPGLAPERLAQITADARHYGFHATLKPPFALAVGANRRALLDAVADLAASERAFDAPPLMLRSLGGFLALTPAATSTELEGLAARCVEQLDGFRAPAPTGELAKRRAAGLTPRQDALLLRWGYPYVMEEFRFHLTLTQRLGDDERGLVQDFLAPLAARFGLAPVRVDAVAVYEQPDRATPFRLIARFPFGRP